MTRTKTRALANTPNNAVSVLDYGAVGDGVTDDTAAFQAAANDAPSERIFTQTTNVTRTPTASIYVPAGNYNLTSTINSNGKYIYWYLDAGAVIPSLDTYGNNYNGDDDTWSSFNPIWGCIVRNGQRTNLKTMGTRDLACGSAFMIGGNPQRGAEVNGFSSTSSLAAYPEFGAVGVYSDVYADSNDQIRISSVASYGATSVTLTTPLSVEDANRCLQGVIISTFHEPAKFSAVIDSVSADRLTINVQGGWFVPDNNSLGQLPPGTDGLAINPITKIWGSNFQAKIPTQSMASAATGIEVGLSPWKEASDRFGRDYARSELNTTPHVWGIHSTNFTNNKIQKHFYADGASWFGLHVEDSDTGYWYSNNTDVSKNALLVEDVTNHPYRAYINGNGAYNINIRTTTDTGVATIANTLGNDVGGASFWDSFIYLGKEGATDDAIVRLGRGTTTSNPRIILDPVGNPAATPTFIQARVNSSQTELRLASNDTSGWTLIEATDTAGRIYLKSPDVLVDGATRFRPSDDNATKLGDASNRWSQLYAGTSTISTSDAALKTSVNSLDEAEQRVAVKIKGLVKKYQFKDAIEAKSAEARIHVGFLAQDVIQAFESEGLEAYRYGIVCVDSWVDEETEELKEVYGLRYEELLTFIIAAL